MPQKQWFAAASKCLRRGIQKTSHLPRKPYYQQGLLLRPFSNNQPPHPSETFLTGNNNAYVEEMYASWKTNPQR
jgi:hypothetical protein